MKVLISLLLSFALVVPGFAKEKKKPEADPVRWGVLGHASGCVIFKESHKTEVTPVTSFGTNTKKVYDVLDLIETDHYDLAQKHWNEDKDSLNQLQQLAVSDQLTMVKIQDGYSSALLDKARLICAESLVPIPGADTGPQAR